MKKNTYL